MNNRFEHIDDIIAKFLAGEASADEIKLLEEWKSLSDENRKEVEQFARLFDESGSLKDVMPVDTDAAWMHLKETIRPPETGRVIPINSRSHWTTFLRIAAMVILVAGMAITVYLFTVPKKENLVAIEAIDSVRKELLPDGSEISINKNSTLTWSPDRYHKKRFVQLKGEAFFDVKHDESRPFIVEASGLKIEDLGTSFNVNNVDSTSTVIVSVVSGEVEVRAVDETRLLAAGEEITYDLVKKTFGDKTETNPNISAYVNRVFVFENAELKTIMKVLNEIYETKLAVDNDALLTCRITVTFDNETIEEISNVLGETLGLTLRKENETIIFSGDGCR